MIIKRDKSEFISYLTDASNFKGDAEALFIPECESELIELLRDHNLSKTAVTVSGAGTGLTGARVPAGGSVISLEKFNRILHLDEDKKILTLQSFVTLEEIEDYLQPYNLFYPVNPTETKSSIGGNIATNASGSRTYKYGATRNFVRSLKVILPDGDKLNISRGQFVAHGLSGRLISGQNKYLNLELPDISMPEVKNASGYFVKPGMDLIDLFIGSEGTLGVITEAEIKLLQKPQNILSLFVFFDNTERLLDFLDYIKSHKNINIEPEITGNVEIDPRIIEYFDRSSLKLLQTMHSQIPSAEGALWIEQEFNSAQEDKLLSIWSEIISKYTNLMNETWTGLSESDSNKFSGLRHDLPLLVNEELTKHNQIKKALDCSVPDRHFREYYRYLTEMLKRNDIQCFNYGHIGNSHIHSNMIISDQSDYAKAEDIYLNAVRNAIELGGTISAEHGIGKIKKEYLTMMYGEQALKGFRKIKKVFDPNIILNRGNIFD